MNNPLKNLLKLYSYLDKKSRIKVFLNLFLSIVNSLLESLSLSSSLIFFTILFSGKISDISFINKFFPFLINLPTSFYLFIFIIIFTITGIIRIYYIKNTLYLSRYLGNQLSSLAFLKIINQKYEYHLDNNTSLQVSILTNDVGESVTSIASLLQIISSSISLLSIILTITFIIYSKSILFILVIPLIYYLLYKLYADKFKINSKLISDLNGKEIDFVKDSLFSIRNILLSSQQEYYFKTFRKIDGDLKEAQALNNFYSVFPRNAIEVLIVVAFTTLFIISPKFTSPSYLPIFGSLIFAIQRIFPLFQLIYYGFSTIKSSESGVAKHLKLLSLKTNKNFNRHKKIFNFKSLSLSNVSYLYPKTYKKILDDISLEIKAGDRIGIYGSSGSGKTTLINILMALLVPKCGQIKVNNRIINPDVKENIFSNYQSSISHIPQTIHLVDGDILTNIVGLDSKVINQKRLSLALDASYLNDFVCSLPRGINTNVGENGAQLSGGQKQRIGIAREIYKMKQILVLDEATNALDPKVENKIIQRLFRLKYLKLIIIISHKKENLFECNRIIEMSSEGIIDNYI